MVRAACAIGIVLAVTWGSAAAGATPAAARQTLEYSVKANYLVRFAAFVEWPASAFAGAQSPVTICVLGRDPFGPALDRAARAQTAHGRGLVVRHPSTAETTAGCHIVYLGLGAGVLQTGVATPPGTLVITDEAVSARRGMIHFVVDDARVRFHIDQRAAARGGLSMSSRLLNLALTVRES